VERRAHAEARTTYLVEHYRPGLTVDGFREWAARVRDTAGEMKREGKAVRYLRSTIVPADEALLCVLDAASEELVRETYARAGISFERISAAITAEEGADATEGDGDRRGAEGRDHQ
jgi:Nickel responsive protein SCO4226-like